jgi:hypothetical protein
MVNVAYAVQQCVAADRAKARHDKMLSFVSADPKVRVIGVGERDEY